MSPVQAIRDVDGECCLGYAAFHVNKADDFHYEDTLICYVRPFCTRDDSSAPGTSGETLLGSQSCQ